MYNIMLVLLLSVAFTEDTPCKWELNNVRSVCRALGRKSPECARAIDDYKMCKAEKGGNDPLEGVE